MSGARRKRHPYRACQCDHAKLVHPAGPCNHVLCDCQGFDPVLPARDVPR